MCGINYPAEPRFAECPVHGSPTAWMSAINPDEFWEWSSTEILIRTQAQLQRVSETPTERPDGLYQIPQRRLPRRLSDGDVFEVEPTGPTSEDSPCDCLWEVLFVVSFVYIVRPLRVPDHVPAA